jgi:hypothetical protein
LVRTKRKEESKVIQCPICQVVNEDTALFCAECGQRFGPAASEPPKMQSAPPQQPAPQAQPLASLAQQQPNQKKIKLHSPMLSGGDEPEEEGYSKPQLSRLRGTSNAGPGGRPSATPQTSEGRSTGGRKHLRSPLLGGADDDFDEEEEEPVSRSKPAPRKTGGGGLRSPLLGESGGDFDDDDEPPAPRSSSGKKPKLRSPLLGEDDDDEDDYPAQRRPKPRPTSGGEPPRSSSASGGLRSPLLGGGDAEPVSPGPMAPKGRSAGGLRSPLLKGGDDYDDDDDEPVRPSPNRTPKSPGRQKLHSPMLGDSDSYYDDDDDDDDEDDDGNPDVLRSPLLAAKKSVPLIRRRSNLKVRRAHRRNQDRCRACPSQAECLIPPHTIPHNPRGSQVMVHHLQYHQDNRRRTCS